MIIHNKDDYENIVFKMADISYRPQFVHLLYT